MVMMPKFFSFNKDLLILATEVFHVHLILESIYFRIYGKPRGKSSYFLSQTQRTNSMELLSRARSYYHQQAPVEAGLPSPHGALAPRWSTSDEGSQLSEGQYLRVMKEGSNHIMVSACPKILLWCDRFQVSP